VPEAGSRGCLAATAGAGVGGLILGSLALFAVHGRVADADNGLFHDADAGLLYLAPLAAWVGAVLGGWALLRLAGQPRAGRTGCAVAAVFPFAVVLALATYSAQTIVLAPFLAGAVARALTAGRRSTSDERGPAIPSEHHEPS